MTRTFLSESPSGLAWLANFPQERRGLAKILLDGLRVVSADQFRVQLTRLANEVVSTLEDPIALYAVRAPERSTDGVSHIEPDVNRRQDSHDGSELIVAHILRDVANQRPASKTVYHYPPTELLRSRKIKSVVFVDDYAGSGDTVDNYVSAWKRNKTIRSWISYGLIRFSYVAFSVSREAQRKIEKIDLLRDRVDVVEHGHDIDGRQWTEDEKQDIRRLCLEYAHRRYSPLGWQGSAGLFASAHAVPNNLPAIFIQKLGPHGEPWTPLFQRHRGMTPDQQEEFAGCGPVSNLLGLASRLGQQQLGRKLSEFPDHIAARFYIILAAHVRKYREAREMSRDLGMNLFEFIDLRQVAIELGFIDPVRHRLTDDGLLELRRVSLLKRTPHVVPDNAELYYPWALRGGRTSREPES